MQDRHMRAGLSGIAVVFLVASACTDSPPTSSRNLSPVEADCANPAPLYGEFDPNAPDYDVVFHDGIDPIAETDRLAAVYGFTPTSVHTFVPVFFAPLTDDVRDRLRCEPSVQLIEYNAAPPPPVRAR